METIEVTLKISYDPAQIDSPAQWNWAQLLNTAHGEVKVMDVTPVLVAA